MGVPTPFFPRLFEASKSLRWREWAGYYVAEKFDPVHDNEYHMVRQSAGYFDVTPLFKYDVTGPDAARLLDLVMVRDVTKLKVDQVGYTAWCDEDGKTIDDGTVTCLSPTHYRVTAAHPTMGWFRMHAHKLDVKIDDVSDQIAALAVQGPRARAILVDAGLPVSQLGFFKAQCVSLGAYEVLVTRTGYTGDLGFELWVENAHACDLYDRIAKAGEPHHAGPAGMLALDLVRVEAGFIMIDVDYHSARHALTDDQKSSPYEIGLGWVVNLKKAEFVGREALAREKERGSRWATVGLDIDWDEMEAFYDAVGLPPSLPTAAWRESVPLYDRLSGRQVGYGTSGCWSPLLKRNLAIATVESAYSTVGTEMKIEMLIEHSRKLVTARVVDRPFFDPPRKRTVPEAPSKRELVGASGQGA
ncbi:MAG: aminomethyl transferase family protein [Proteobacteria bacterium]|nr:aminomethyl transferase family protein [Pseudomonadota bacterium]